MPAGAVSRAVWLGALTAAGQLLIVGTLPVYTRLFDPGVYGEYLIFVGLVGVAGVLAGLRYDSAVVLPRDERVAAALSAIVLLVAATVSGVLGLATLVACHPAGALCASLGPDFGYGLAVATLVGAAQRLLVSWCIREGHFLRMGAGQFLFCLASIVAQLGLLPTLGEMPALIWGYVIALTVQTTCLFPAFSARRAAWTLAASPRGLRVIARKYRRFPIYMVGYALASSMRDRLIQIALGLGAGSAVVGRFGLAYRVMFAPNSLIYSAASPVFYSIASRGSRAEVGRIAASAVEATFIGLVVIYVVIAVEAPAITDSLLSERWRGTGPFLQALAAPALLLATTCWLDRAFDSFRRQRVAFALEASFTVLAVTLVAALSRIVPPLSVAWVFATLGAIYYWIYFLSTFLACGFPMPAFWRACCTGAGAAAMTVGACLLIRQIPAPFMRGTAYLLLQGFVLGSWFRFRNGRAVLRDLLHARVGSGAAP